MRTLNISIAVGGAILSLVLRSASAQQYATTFHQRPWASAIAAPILRDLNGNGMPDLIFRSTTNGNAADLIVVHSDPGLSAPPQTPAPPLVNAGLLPVPGVVSSLDVADFDGDGFADLLFGAGAYSGSIERVYFLRGTGTGAFIQPPVVVATNLAAGSPVVGDFNADGRADFAMIGLAPTGASYALEIYLGASLMPWPQASAASIGFFPSNLVAGDFNGDGADDLVYGISGAITFNDEQLLGIPAGSPNQPQTFSPPITLATNVFSTVSVRPVVFDYDGDGRDDFMAQGSFFRGQSAGGFAATPVPSGFLGGASPMTPDTNGDGLTDWVTMAATSTPSRFRILECRGPFAAAPQSYEIMTIASVTPSLSIPTVPSGVFCAGDLDADGDTDFLIVERAAYLSGFHVVENRGRYGQGAAGTVGVPEISVTSPVLGAPAFSIGLANARPASLAVLLLSMNPVVQPGIGVHVNLAVGAQITVNGQWIAGLTDPTGAGLWTTALPSSPALAGFVVFAQWAVIDPAGAFAVGGVNAALTVGRAITFR